MNIIFFRVANGQREQITLEVNPKALSKLDLELLARHRSESGRIFLSPGKYLSLPTREKDDALIPLVIAGLSVHEQRQSMVLAGFCTFGVCPLLALLFHPGQGCDQGSLVPMYVIGAVGVVGALCGFGALLFYHRGWPSYITAPGRVS